MFGTHDLLLFVAAGLLLNITPGPDTLYIAGRSTAQGWRAGAAAALGVGAGCLIHTTAAAIGLSALLAASTEAFAVVKMVGAAYLAYVGIGLVLSSGTARAGAPGRSQSPVSLRKAFVQGCLTNALNPKVALFFLAFLPQFVSPEAPSKALAFLLLGAIFNLTGTAWNLGVAVFTARLAQGIRRHGRLLTWFNRCVGAVFVYIGVRLVFIRPV
jgi:threonine/homoserine/homoserine lactone efflux protein